MGLLVTLVRGVYPGAFAFTSNVAAGDTVRIGNVLYTFAAAPSSAYEVDVGGDLDTSIANLVAAINASGTPGTEYAAGTLAHPDFTAAADLPNDEIDLTARLAGSASANCYLAASSPGGNDISPGAAFTGGISGATDGSGSLDDAVAAVLARAQLNSQLLAELSFLTDAAD